MPSTLHETASRPCREESGSRGRGPLPSLFIPIAACSQPLRLLYTSVSNVTMDWSCDSGFNSHPLCSPLYNNNMNSPDRYKARLLPLCLSVTICEGKDRETFSWSLVSMVLTSSGRVVCYKARSSPQEVTFFSYLTFIACTTFSLPTPSQPPLLFLFSVKSPELAVKALSSR